MIAESNALHGELNIQHSEIIDGLTMTTTLPEYVKTEFTLNAGETLTKKSGYKASQVNVITFEVDVRSDYHASRLLGLVQKCDDELEVILSDRRGYNFGISLTHTVTDDLLTFTLSGSSENANISLIARLQS